MKSAEAIYWMVEHGQVAEANKMLAIQRLDAAKWGMEQAAIKSYPSMSNDVSPETRRRIYEEIITFANNLTIDQLPK